VTSVAVKTVGFAVADDDRPLLDRLVERYDTATGRSLRAAMKVMAAEERAERLRSLQESIQAQTGQIYSPTQVNELVRSVLKPRG
jgi:hypothetical protein